MLDYLVDGLIIVAVIYGVVAICYWTYKFYQTWQKVKTLIQNNTDDNARIGEIYKESVTDSPTINVSFSEQVFDKSEVELYLGLMTSAFSKNVDKLEAIDYMDLLRTVETRHELEMSARALGNVLFRFNRVKNDGYEELLYDLPALALAIGNALEHINADALIVEWRRVIKPDMRKSTLTKVVQYGEGVDFCYDYFKLSRSSYNAVRER